MSRSVLKPQTIAWLLATAGFLSACGGGGGGGSDSDHSDATWSTNPAGAATFNGAAAAYQGSISGLGSIVVNGVRFETTDSVVYDSDDFSTSYDSSTPTFSSPLALGMTVALFGDVDDAQSLGRAARIRIVGGVRGTMNSITSTAIDLSTQMVQINAATTYGGTSDGTLTGTAVTTYADLAALANTNPLLTIYGLAQADGSFLATRVVVTHALTHALDVAVRGTITAIAGSNYTIQTGATASITVNCNSCTIQPTGNTPVVGDAIRALATDNTSWNGTTLTAKRLQLVNAAYLTSFSGAPSTSTYAKIKGIATQANGNWYVGGVQVSGATLTANTMYEIKGTWSGSVLAATRVETEGQRSFTDSYNQPVTYSNEFYGAVSNLSGSTFTVQGVNVNAGSAYFPNGSAANLSNGSFVEVKGSYVDGTLNATKVEIKYASSSNASSGRVFEMYGQVGGWSGVNSVFSLTRFGVVYTAQTSANTRFKYGTPTTGSYVEVKGYMDANNVFQVIKLELKNGYHDYDD
ncbi:DUF5666 domain-containing protein [Limnohabitans sp. INBF002]|uniref:DUF5666 domain-containing protein n=1 Tax=Limnohabitans sp. INBF002 TaxID=2986280 RepID=UPI0023771E8F|nr:DUF5666 domain-containing protein [Limnohabitans sp. INBF002]BDU51821.1 hypothetical protein LINBF2_00560 [Limnohabitans sp. INBF002]